MMWKILKYDIRNSRVGFLILAGLLLFVILVGIGRVKELGVSSIFISAILMMIISGIGFTALFLKIYASRFLKDDIVNYTGISKKAIQWEPVVFILIFYLLISCLLYAMLWYVGSTKDFLTDEMVRGFFKQGTNTNLTIVKFVLSFGSVFLLYGSLSLGIWTVLKNSKFKSNERNESATFIIISGAWLLMYLIMNSPFDRNLEIGFMYIVSIIFIGFYFIMNRNQTHKRKG